MPPNRKADILLLDDLPLIDPTNLKLPESREQTAPLTPASNGNSGSAESASYWDWDADTKDEEIQRIQEEEKIRDLFSASHIEGNLIKESQRLKDTASKQEESPKKSLPSSDDYWNMPTTTTDVTTIDEQAPLADEKEARVTAATTTTTKAQEESRLSASYWNWPSVMSQDKERMIQMVLEEQRARRLTSGAACEANLLADAATRQQNEDVPSLKAAHDAYWVY